MSNAFLQERIKHHMPTMVGILEQLRSKLAYNQDTLDQENLIWISSENGKMRKITEALELLVGLVDLPGFRTEGYALKKDSDREWVTFLSIAEKRLDPKPVKISSGSEKIRLEIKADGTLHREVLWADFKVGKNPFTIISWLRNDKYIDTKYLSAKLMITEAQVRSHIKDINKHSREKLDLAIGEENNLIIHKDGYGYHINPLYRLTEKI